MSHLLQLDLKVEEWCKANCMFININKTKCMLTGTQQRLSNQTDEPTLRIHSEVLKNSSCEKLLGVKIDSTLSWNSQVDHICATISSRIYLLSRIKKFLNMDARKAFYNGYILPIIDYCCIIWGGCSNERLSRILKLQKRAIRLILDVDALTPSAPLFKDLGWMTIDSRIKYHTFLLVQKSLKGDAPLYLTEKFEYLSPNSHCPLRNSTQGNLIVPRCKTELYKKSFVYSGSTLWNQLPSNLRILTNTNSFKYNLKNYLKNSQ